MTKHMEIMATLAIVVVAIVVVVGRTEERPDRSARITPTDPGADVIDLPSADTLAMWYELGHRVGPEDAPIRIIEWGSYACTFCVEFAAAIDSVQKRFPGMISVTWLHALPPKSDLTGIDTFTAHATECVVDQIPFEALYETVLLEGRSIDNRARLFAAVSDLGMEDERLLEACVDSWTHRDRLSRYARLGEAAGVTSTPTWYLNEIRYEFAVSAATLQRMALARLRR